MTEEKTMESLRLSSGDYSAEYLKALPLDRLKVIRRKLTFKLSSLSAELKMLDVRREADEYVDLARYERVLFAYEISKAWMLRLNEWIHMRGNEYQAFYYEASRRLDSDTFAQIKKATESIIKCEMSSPVFPEDLE